MTGCPTGGLWSGLNNPFQIRAEVLGVTVTPAVVTLPSVAQGVGTPVTWTVKNTFGPVAVKGQGGPLGSAKALRPTIADGASQEYTVVVPAGATRLDVAINNPSDPAADLDLSVYRGATLVGQSADGDSDESVSLANPAAGTYTVVIDGYSVPAGSTQFDYRDVFYSAALGTLSAPSALVNVLCVLVAAAVLVGLGGCGAAPGTSGSTPTPTVTISPTTSDPTDPVPLPTATTRTPVTRHRHTRARRRGRLPAPRPVPAHRRRPGAARVRGEGDGDRAYRTGRDVRSASRASTSSSRP